jgi:hypothetical protein
MSAQADASVNGKPLLKVLTGFTSENRQFSVHFAGKPALATDDPAELSQI